MSSGVRPQPAPSNGETKTQEGVRLGALFTQLFSINQRQGRGSRNREGFVWGKKGLKGGAGTYLEGPLRILVA